MWRQPVQWHSGNWDAAEVTDEAVSYTHLDVYKRQIFF